MQFFSFFWKREGVIVIDDHNHNHKANKFLAQPEKVFLSTFLVIVKMQKNISLLVWETQYGSQNVDNCVVRKQETSILEYLPIILSIL